MSANRSRSAAAPSRRSYLTWHVNLLHCDRITGACHTHPLQSSTGTAGSFTAPDHEYPSYLELELTARDAHGLTATTTRRLDPGDRLRSRSRPCLPGALLTLGPETTTHPSRAR